MRLGRNHAFRDVRSVCDVKLLPCRISFLEAAFTGHASSSGVWKKGSCEPAIDTFFPFLIPMPAHLPSYTPSPACRPQGDPRWWHEPSESCRCAGRLGVVCATPPVTLGPPVVPFYPFLGEGPPTKNRRKGTLILTSLPEDLVLIRAATWKNIFLLKASVLHGLHLQTAG